MLLYFKAFGQKQEDATGRQYKVLMMKGKKPPVTDINKESKWRGMLAWPVLAIHMYGYIGSLLMIQQYAYYAIQTGKFPGLNHTSSQHSVCEVNTTSDGYQIQLEIQKDTSTLILYMNLAAGIPAIFVNFMISCYSDRYGRKKLLIFTIVIQCVRAVLEALAVYFRWNINVFIAFSLINGLAGAQMGPMTICFSMAADMTSTGKSRSFGIALIDVAIGTGIIFGSFTSGYMIKNIGYSYSFAIIAGFYLLDVCISLFLMETRQPEKDIEIVPLKQNIQDAFRFYIDRQFAKNGTRSIYILCTAIFLTSLVADIGRSNVDVLYELNAPFCWQSVRIGIYGTFMTIAKFWVGIPSIRIFQKCMNDENIIFIGLVSNMLCLVLSGLSPNSLALYFGKSLHT